MLEYNYPTIHETLRTLEKDIKVALDQEKRAIHQSFHKEIIALKEPFLAEILKTYQTKEPLETKYTASDIQ